MSDLSKIKLNGTVYNFKDAVARTPYYGVCSTAKGTAQKTVTISNIETLIDGLSIFVKFTATNTAENPTLKINNLDPVAIKRYGTTAASTSTASSWNAGAVVQLIYDGTNFIMENFNNTTYSAMTEAEMQTGTATTARNITATRLKQAIEYHAPVTSVNGDTGAITIDEIQTTAGENNVEYDLIGTAPANTNSGLVPLYKPTLVTFAKTTDYGRLTLGSSDTPGVLRIYSSTTNASGYTDLKTGSSSTNTRTITFPDATGTVALTSDIPSVSSWALAANKPSYTFSELTSHPTSIGGYGITDAYTKTEVDGLVSGVLHYKGTKATVSALPSSGNTTGDTWHVTADGSEWAWDGSDWQELGTAVDLSGYVPTSRTVNGKALTSDISLTASDVSALPSNTTYVSSFNGESGAITYTAPVTSVNGQTGAVTITDSDEKLKTTALSTTGVTRYLVFGEASSTASAKEYSSLLTFTRYSNSVAWLSIGSSGSTQGRLRLHHTASNGYVDLVPSSTAARTISLPDATGTLALTSDIPTSASDVGALADDCAAAGITSTDISNWNALVSDDKTWNGVALGTSGANTAADAYVPSKDSTQASGTATWAKATSTPTNYCIAKYDNGPYLKSTTPTSGDSSTKVATTAFVGTAIAAITASDVGALADDSVAAGITSTDISNWNAKLSSFTETDPTVPSWAKASSKPTYTASEVGAVPASKTNGDIYAGIKVYADSNTGILLKYDNDANPGADIQLNSSGLTITVGGFGGINTLTMQTTETRIHNVVTPTANGDAANKQYVDTAISGISVPQPYNATTNPTGYLRITDLPIYDGTVV